MVLRPKLPNQGAVGKRPGGLMPVSRSHGQGSHPPQASHFGTTMLTMPRVTSLQGYTLRLCRESTHTTLDFR